MTPTDAGALVALFDKRDPHHVACLSIAKRLPPGPMLTTWPCLTEAAYMLGKVGGWRYQERLWALRRSGRLLLLDITSADADRMAALMALYSNVPMDLADASLVALAESRNFRRVFTVDSDFYIYRLADGSALEVIR